MAKYDQDFFLRTYNVNRRSAEIVLSTLFEVADIRSAVDVGCGLGTWLEAAQQLGVDSILGIDGHWLQDEVELKIDRNQVIFQNLEEGFAIDSNFDLAISLEVAEHLSAESADVFVENLCSLSDLILFSAAIPGQGGKNHINEQWQSYWANKFENNGFNAYDFIRQRLWARNDVQPYYRQNIILYCRTGSAEDRKLNNMTPAVTDCRELDVVIPEIYLNRIKPRGINKIQIKGIASFFRKFFSKVSS